MWLIEYLVLSIKPYFSIFSTTSIFRLLLFFAVSRSYSFWIGSHYPDKEKDWIWIDDRLVLDDTKVWATGQPSQSRFGSCMEVRPALRLFSASEMCRVPNYFVCQQGSTWMWKQNDCNSIPNNILIIGTINGKNHSISIVINNMHFTW